MTASPPDTSLIATYQLSMPAERFSAEALEKAARQIAIGQTIGTANAQEVEALKDYMAKVVDITPMEATPPDVTQRQALIRVAFPVKTVDCDLGTLLAVLFGKLSMAGPIRLVDLAVPESLVSRYGGPRFGISGVRQQVGVPSGPLLMSIFKPCLGLPESVLADMFRTQALGGVNLVKDDEILSDKNFDTARRRLAACLEAGEAARRETGRTVLYAINLTGPAESVLDRARILVADGANALLFNYLCYGLPMLNALRLDSAVNVPLVAHPSLAGAFYGSPLHGVSPAALFGTLPRLAGADLVLFPSPYGSVALPLADALAVKTTLTQPVYDMLPAFPVPSAGITAEMIPQMVADFGSEMVINAGTGIHDYPEGSLAGAHRFVETLQAATQTPQPRR